MQNSCKTKQIYLEFNLEINVIINSETEKNKYPFNIRSVYFCKIVTLYALFFAYLSFFIHYFFTIKTDNFYRKKIINHLIKMYISGERL